MATKFTRILKINYSLCSGVQVADLKQQHFAHALKNIKKINIQKKKSCSRAQVAVELELPTI